MKWTTVLFFAVLIAGALGWWYLGHPGYETTEQKLARYDAAEKAAEPKVYRWRDDKGVLHVTDTPPSNRPYEKVELNEDVNVMPPPELPETTDKNAK